MKQKLSELKEGDMFWIDEDDDDTPQMFLCFGRPDVANTVIEERNLGILCRTGNNVKEYYNPEQIVVKYEPNFVWISAIDSDSFNYSPKKVPKDKVDLAIKTKEIPEYWYTEEEAQRDCDYLNSL